MGMCLSCVRISSSTRMSAFFALIALMTLALVLAASVRAAEVPAPPKGKGESCVESVDFMRRHHMEMLKHQRGDTVRQGARDGRFSLKGCVDCHAVKGADGKPVSFNDSKHFCRSCHDYAAVRIDCFECHASRPEGQERLTRAPNGAETAALADYLKRTANAHDCSSGAMGCKP